MIITNTACQEMIQREQITVEGNMLKVVGVSTLLPGDKDYIKKHKAEIVQLLNRKTCRPVPYLKNGEFIMQGLPPAGQTILDVLLELDAPDDVIKKYIDSKLTPSAWARWQGVEKEKILTE